MGGLKALVAGPLRKEFYFAASLTYSDSNYNNYSNNEDGISHKRKQLVIEKFIVVIRMTGMYKVPWGSLSRY